MAIVVQLSKVDTAYSLNRVTFKVINCIDVFEL